MKTYRGTVIAQRQLPDLNSKSDLRLTDQSVELSNITEQSLASFPVFEI